MKNLVYICLLLSGLFMPGCEDIQRGVPIDENDIAPGIVSQVEVRNFPGGATLSYKLPDSESLRYVLAEYSLKGVTVEKKSSYYNNSVTVEGFPNTNEYEVKLYAVSWGDKKSDPVTVKITPLEPPVISVFESFVINPTFGGVRISFENETGANLKMIVLTTDSLGDYHPVQTYYTKRESGSFSARGFDAEERPFGFYVVDRWDNYSDTLFTKLTPLFEEELDKSKFEEVHLPTDTWQQHGGSSYGNGVKSLWDGVWNVSTHGFVSVPGTGVPQWFTFDLGETARLSRFKFYHRYTRDGGTDGAYYAGDVEVMEIWGSNNPTDSWDSWTLLGHFQSIKPSGQTPPTTEDYQFACVDGEDFEFPSDIPPVRYLRVKTLKVWGGVTYIYMTELTFWGSTEQ